jgi:hypothetical protein
MVLAFKLYLLGGRAGRNELRRTKSPAGPDRRK